MPTARQSRRVNRVALDKFANEGMNPLILDDLAVPSFDDIGWGTTEAVEAPSAYVREMNGRGLGYQPTGNPSDDLAALKRVYEVSNDENRVLLAKEAGRILNGVVLERANNVSLVERNEGIILTIKELKRQHDIKNASIIRQNKGFLSASTQEQELASELQSFRGEVIPLLHEKTELNQALTSEYRNALETHRGEAFGHAQGINVGAKSSLQASERLQEASRFFPESWIARANQYPLHAVSLPLSERVSFSPSWSVQEVMLSNDSTPSRDRLRDIVNRDLDGKAQDLIYVYRETNSPDMEMKAVGASIHEYMHRMEEHVPEVTRLEAAFLESRRLPTGADGTKESLVPLIRAADGVPSERVFTDSFADIYSGRVYARHEKGRTRYELMSTASEAIFAGEHKYFKMGDEHQNYAAREFRDFALGVLLLARVR